MFNSKILTSNFKTEFIETCLNINQNDYPKVFPDNFSIEYYDFYFYDNSSAKQTGVTILEMLPENDYTIEFWAQYPKDTGTWYGAYSTTTTTSNLSLPSASSSLPSYYPTVRDQYMYVNNTYYGEPGTCVAQSLVLALDVLEKRERGTNDNHYSANWIFGNRKDGNTGDFLNYYDAINALRSDGTPKWDRVPSVDRYPDNRFFNDYSGQTGARNLYLNNVSNLAGQAMVQKINANMNGSNPRIISFYDCETIANSITNNGCHLLAMETPDVIDDPDLNGVIGYPSSNYSRGGHSMIAIGWKTINSTKYWICQNSWGSGYGDSGLCYIPMDWGLTSPKPNASYQARWIYATFELQNYVSSSPVTPNSPLLDSTTPRVASGFNLDWNYTNYSDTFTLRYKESGGSYTEVGNITVNNHELTGLNYGTSYYIGVKGVNYVGDSSYSSDNIATTAPKTPTISEQTHDETSITVNFNVSAGNWSFVKLWYRIGSGSWSSVTVNYNENHGHITGLTTGQRYEIKASSFFTTSGVDIESVDASGNTGYSSSIYVTVGTARPSNWSWSYTISSGSSVYSVVNKNIYIMPYQEWNSFTTRINEFRVYKSLSSYSFTSVSSETALTTTIINQALTAIRDMSAYFTGGKTVPSNRSTGDNILVASYYLNMRDALNSIT